jgi:hypothetical protein
MDEADLLEQRGLRAEADVLGRAELDVVLFPPSDVGHEVVL